MAILTNTQLQRDIVFQVYHICKNRSISRFKKADIDFRISRNTSTVYLLEYLQIVIVEEEIKITDLSTNIKRNININDIVSNFDQTSFVLAHGRDPFIMDYISDALLEILFSNLQKKDKPC